MTEALLDALGPVLTRWTMGGAGAVAAAPPAWRDALGSDAQEAELRLLALSGQFLGTLALAEPSGDLRMRADLPRLSLPPVADPLRPLARRLLRPMADQASRRDLLDFLAARGWALHPGDWMPGQNDDVPAVYAPWQDWIATSVQTTADPLVDTIESWDLLGPAGRRAAFAAMRRQDAAQASAFLADKIGAETSEMRLRLLEIVAAGLFEGDVPLLEGLAADRAPRVRALAASLLARLGHGQTDGDDVAELAGFFSVHTKGLLRRTRVIVVQPLKTPAQRNRRTALMGSTGFDAFASALGLTSGDLIAAWPWQEERAADHALAEMAARSAPDTVVGAMAEALPGQSIDPHALAPLLPRLSSALRRQAAIRLLQAKGGSFALALGIAGGDGGIHDLVRTAAGTRMIEALKAPDAVPAEQSAELLALGLLASRVAARQALDHVAEAGLTASDLRLDMLRLNAALDDTGA